MPASEDCGSAAVFANVRGVVRYNDHGPIGSLYKQLVIALFMKACVADRDDFVNQEAVKINHHG